MLLHCHIPGTVAAGVTVLAVCFFLSCSSGDTTTRRDATEVGSTDSASDALPVDVPDESNLPIDWRAIDVWWDIPAAECVPGHGFLGCPCPTSLECLSRYCEMHMGDRVCTSTCTEECPAGWTCQLSEQGGIDPVYLCKSNFPNLCLPCKTDTDCPGHTTGICLRYSPESGSFCGHRCQSSTDCPAGYECQDSHGADGAVVRSCTRQEGDCPCTTFAVSEGRDTRCQHQNTHGICHGFRECTAQGLSDCSARIPAAEICDGEDNNCDGVTDGDYLCADGNECTNTWCGGITGCQTENLDQHCTGDSDPCTLDLCVEGICSHPPGNDGQPCDDGDPCTLNDICQSGSCQWTRVNPLCQKICGDGVCSTLESGTSGHPDFCAVDCGPCGDGICGLHEMGPNGGSCPPDCLAACGDGICQGGESYLSCPIDCGGCGDGLCGLNESPETCLADCPFACGNGLCESGETPQKCPADCISPCGDGICGYGENPYNCPVDCTVCGDGVCGVHETKLNCPQDCDTACGNGVCEGGESASGCPVDCGSCGDGVCGFHESPGTCPIDCYQGCGDGTCAMGETCKTCPADCGVCCGNGVCELGAGETQCSCPEDCGGCVGCCVLETCWGGTQAIRCGTGGDACHDCESNRQSCLEQVCQFVCGDAMCGAEESKCTCPADCGLPCAGLQCGDNGCGGSCGNCQIHHECQAGKCVYVPWCGDGHCDPAENCATCSQDCLCPCGHQCLEGTCTHTACLGRECGDDGCGVSCGTCNTHYECQKGQCIYVPWCGDAHCDPGEHCFNCPDDCGQCCGNSLCEPDYAENCGQCPGDCLCGCGEECQDSQCRFIACDQRECGHDGCGGSCGECSPFFECDAGLCYYTPGCGDEVCDDFETCDSCPLDCGQCCGNGWCNMEFGENCNSCPADCACSECGESCQSGLCVFSACAERECGPDGCGGSCGECLDHHVCKDGACIYVPWCGDSHCDPDEDCSSCPEDCGRCVGLDCEDPGDCHSGFCADGVCCAVACNDPCRSCALPDKAGACEMHPLYSDPDDDCPACMVCNGFGSCVHAFAGTDPVDDCIEEAPCELDGLCDGLGACRPWIPGTLCNPASCSGNVHSPADFCNETGECTDSGTVPCAPYVCDGPVCRTNCGADSHCTTGNYCSGSRCVAKRASGWPCLTANECTSGQCADGVCCNTACQGTCRACNIPGSAGQCKNHLINTDPETECGLCKACNGSGTCQAVPSGTDPLGQCLQLSPTTCALDGQCDGQGACRLWLPDTVCVPQTCSGSNLHLADYCSGDGACLDSGIQFCDPYRCGDNVCRTQCTEDRHCITGYFCDESSSCQAEKAIGASCDLDSQCQSGLCVDSVCCAGSCDGPCQSCNLVEAPGQCRFHAPDTDPEDECGLCRTCNGSGECSQVWPGTDPLDHCPQTSSASCDTDGTCDGAGRCRFWDDQTQCVPVSCVDATLFPARFCDGQGACVDSTSIGCAPYLCEGTSCAQACSSPDDCVDGYYCDGTACSSDKTTGQTCRVGTECESGLCSDGVCCSTPCSGLCRSCNIPGVEGQCVYFGSVEDPDGECGICRTCDGAGACSAVSQGADPLDHCPATERGTCSTRGYCDGTGVCTIWPFGTPCLEAHCSGDDLVFPRFCDGLGQCPDTGRLPCGPYTCREAACLTVCAAHTDCAGGHYCLDAQCAQVLPDGAACQQPQECSSGFCTDGVCCSTTCQGACRACNLPGVEGHCFNFGPGTDPEEDCGHCRMCNGLGACADVPAGSDPLAHCQQDPAATCGQDGSCDSPGTCRLWSSATVCAAQACSKGTVSWTDFCDGNGTCGDSGTQSCTPYACDGRSCRTTCSADAHCQEGRYCHDSSCVSP